MSARVFVDNLPAGTTEEALRALFEGRAGAVVHVSIMTDRRSGDSHGYAFVDMATDDGAARAVATLHGHLIHGVPLHVSPARPRAQPRKVEP